jgi:phosphatidylglycerophosphate synthase
MTYKEVYEKAVPQKKRKEERWNLFTSLVIRPVSILLTIPLINTTVRPTTITKISVLFSIIGFLLIYLGNSTNCYIVGWVCFFLWGIFDGIDGSLARCTNQCSSLGDLWDTTGGYAAMVLINISAGIIAFRDTNCFELCDKYQYLIWGGLSAVMSIFPRLVLHKKKSSEPLSDSVKKLSDKKKFGLSQILAMNIVSPTGGLLVFFLVCILFHMNNILITAYTVINFVVMMLSLKDLLKEA